MSKPSFFAELQRRHVYKVGAAYAVAGWLLAQVVTQVLPVFGVSLLGQRVLVLIVIAGFPLALILAWLFDVTPTGIVRTEALPVEGETLAVKHERVGVDRKLNWLLGGLLFLALGYFGAERIGWVSPAGLGSKNGDEAAHKSIAVLPFENLSDESANAYFAAGIQDEILTQLAKLGELQVISRTSTKQYGSKPENLREIARQLGVDNILEGSVQKVGGSVRVNVQLIRAATDEHLWAETYDRKLDDVFGVQNEIAGAVAVQLDAKLSRAERQSLSAVSTRNPEAYDAYLRALAVGQRTDIGASDKSLAAIELLQKATQADPGFSDAWAELSDQVLSRYIGRGEGERLKQAKEASETALRLQPDSAKAWNAVGDYRASGLNDSTGAIDAYQHALHLAPNDPETLASLASLKEEAGNTPEALADYRKVTQLNPRDSGVWMEIASIYYRHRQFPESRAALQKALDLTPRKDSVIARIALTWLSEGETDRAATELAKLTFDPQRYRYDVVVAFSQLALQKRDYAATIKAIQSGMDAPQDVIDYATGYFALGQLQMCSGDKAAARVSFAAVESKLEAARKSGHVSPMLPMYLGPTYAVQGKTDAALESAQEGLSRTSGPGELRATARTFLAISQMTTGNTAAAIEQLSLLEREQGSLFTPPTPSIAQLKKDCTWDALRGNSAFEALLAGSADPNAKPQPVP